MKKTFVLAAILGASVIGAAAYARGPASGGFGDDHFSRFDEDGDGKVSVTELDARHKDFLSGADKDGDGFITKEEMKALHETRKAEHKARMFPDANNDGKVSRREFEDAARERFNELDKNGDGLIGEDEMEDHHGMRGRH